jgi:hypothetical protein
MADVEELPFSLDWLAGARTNAHPLDVCSAGHLLVNGRTCWTPVRFSQDLHALICAPVDHRRGGR